MRFVLALAMPSKLCKLGFRYFRFKFSPLLQLSVSVQGQTLGQLCESCHRIMLVFLSLIAVDKPGRKARRSLSRFTPCRIRHAIAAT